MDNGPFLLHLLNDHWEMRDEIDDNDKDNEEYMILRGAPRILTSVLPGTTLIYLQYLIWEIMLREGGNAKKKT